MTYKICKAALLLLSCGLFFFSAQSQTAYTDAEYRQSPLWIKMIDNPGANYYEAIKAHELYWQNRPKPMEEEINDKKEDRKEERTREQAKKQLAKMTPAERNEFDRLNYQNKRFEAWIHEVKPFVQEDGRILTQEERTAIWNKQQEEIKKQKN